jgi:predicted ATP-grasp superfamily ATP-dependent carboligase
MKREHAPRVLVLDGLWNKTVAAVRSLGRRGFFVAAGERTRFAPALFSRYCARRFIHPSAATRTGEFLDALERELRDGRYDVLLPMEFSTQLVVTRHRKRLERWTRIPFADADLALKVQDKRELALFARERGFDIPSTICPEGTEKALALSEGLSYPVLVKPRLSSGGRGIVAAAGPGEFRRVYPGVHARFPFPIVQERIPPGGEALGVGVLMNRASEARASFAYRRLREYPVSGGPSTLRESIRDDALRETAERLLSALGWTGVAMVEFKVDPRDGRPKLLEVNPRFWGSLNHAIVSGVDFPWLLFRLAVEGDVPTVREYEVGVRSRSLLHGEIMHFLASPGRHRPGLLDFSIPDDIVCAGDPLPILGRLSTLVTLAYDREMREIVL